MKDSPLILCCCSGGKVRSVATRYLLEDEYGFGCCLNTGLDKNAETHTDRLCEWAQIILVVGEATLLEKIPEAHRHKVCHFDIGPDVWGSYHKPELLARIRPFIQGMLDSKR